MADICSGITKVDSVHWASLETACSDLVNRKVKASVIGASVVLGTLSVWTFLSACMNISFLLIANRIKGQ
jgi:hypothetical protein